MGRYIDSIKGKSIGKTYEEKYVAIREAGGLRLPEPDRFLPNLVCLVDNGWFGSAAYAYDINEFETMKVPDSRTKQWFILKDAEEYATEI